MDRVSDVFRMEPDMTKPDATTETSPLISAAVERANEAGVMNARVIYEQILRECNEPEYAFNHAQDYIASLSNLAQALKNKNAYAIRGAVSSLNLISREFAKRGARIHEADRLLGRARQFISQSGTQNPPVSRAA